ncbi:winged helix DNA-binding domain-containing protein [Streptomyces finlayi]|uniref:Winged helix DNA-binding domain-containing protein n=1 Tax=Streptomyces finlayi TaxID=67296 RepID=A0A7G7BIR1_9ACTN|nr:winged helix DNA-binding domain-containing protein [Streptomyces finlayi]QNE75226.1 winged helix DNA-binding domain-containing protein [Streptomyces finlayi]
MTTRARTVTVTWPEANARRIGRQALSATPPASAAALPAAASGGRTPADVVGAMLGAHAQVLSAAELSVALRLPGAVRTDVREALWTERTLVKTFGPRGTVHLLPAAELPLWTGALSALPAGPGRLAPGARMTPGQTEEVLAAVADALTGAELTIDELSDAVIARTGPWAADPVVPGFQGMWPRWRQVLHLAGHRGVLCYGPDRGRKATYTNPGTTPLPGPEAVASLVGRYLRAYGPATPAHFAKWLATANGWANRLFAELAATGAIEEVTLEGAPAWVAAGDTDFSAAPALGVRLLPYFDAFTIASQPRERLFPGLASTRALGRGQAGNYPVLLVDGTVAGVWHQRRAGRRIAVTVEPLAPLTAVQLKDVAEQADRVAEILEGTAELTVGTVTVGPHA